MEKYYIDYHTGAGNCYADTLDEAMRLADDGAAYTQQDITIECDGEMVAQRGWVGCLSDLESQEDPIQFGDFGYYADWYIA